MASKKISFWKKLVLYRSFRKTILNNRSELEEKFGARIDYVSRIYTVLNVPTDLIDEPYNVRKSDIDNISKQFIKDYSAEISRYLDSIGAAELYGFYEVEKVGKYSYLLVFGFSLINTDKFARNLLFRYIPILLLLIIGSLLFIL